MPTMTKAGYVPQKPAKGPAKTPKNPKKQGRKPHPERKWTVGAALILILAISLSGLILYLVYGVGSRDLGERLDAKKRWRDRFDRLTGKRKKALKA